MDDAAHYCHAAVGGHGFNPASICGSIGVNFRDHIAQLFSRVRFTRENMHDYQDEAEQFIYDNPFSALFIDLGLGKSVISLTLILRILINFIPHKAILVIGPRRVVNESWPTEIASWQHTAGLTFKHIRDEILVDSVNKAGQLERTQIKSEGLSVTCEKSKHRIELARHTAGKIAVRELMERSPACIYFISRDNVESLVDYFGKDWPYDVVFIDESDSMKDISSNRFKALRRVRPVMKRLHCLTATPCAETYLHLFAQIYLLDQGERFGKSFNRFKETYFDFNKYTYTRTIKPGAAEAIAKKIADITLTMKAEDYLKMDTPIVVNDVIILSDAEMTLYRQMEQDYLVEIGGVEIEAETAAARSQKLIQLASGTAYESRPSVDEWGEVTFGRVVHAVHEHKIDKLRTIIEECHGEPLLVAYTLKSSLARIKEAFPQAVAMDREGKSIAKWNAGGIPLYLISPQSAGHGLNLQQGGRRVVFFDIPWSLGLYKQTIGRLARQGQLKIVVVHHIVAHETIDWDVVQCLQDKNASQERLFALLKSYQRKVNVRKCLNIDNDGL